MEFAAYHREEVNLFLQKAEQGDGQFAIAYAIMRMAEAHDSLRQDLCFGKNSGPGLMYPGCLEKIGMELADISASVQSAADHFTDQA